MRNQPSKPDTGTASRGRSPKSAERRALFAALGLGLGAALSSVGFVAIERSRRSGWQASVARSEKASNRHLDDLLRLSGPEFEQLDVIELNLVIAREIPTCRDLDIDRYRRMVDEWAAHVGHEVERHRYQFTANPAEYKHSWAYFCALMMRTVLDQDLGIRYDLEGFSFEKPEDLFVHGVIDQRRGTCISLPVVQIAIGRRLGWPIKPVAVPGHTFCRWDDLATGERLNIEAANTSGFVDHDDDYYRHWPFEIDPRWEKEHHALKSLTMREYASVLVGALGSYFSAKNDVPATIRWDAASVALDPANRSAFVSLRMSVEQSLPRYFDADELSGRKRYWELKPHPSLLPNPIRKRPVATEDGASVVESQSPNGALREGRTDQ